MSQSFTLKRAGLEGDETPPEKIEKKPHCLLPASRWDH